MCDRAAVLAYRRPRVFATILDLSGRRHARNRPNFNQLLRSLGETRLFVSALAVERAYQRRGVATRLMEAVEQWGRERGATLVSLDTWIDSEQSVPFYERRMGYRRASIIFEKVLEDPSRRDDQDAP